jgi:spheroidene monooxygenase
LQGAPGCLLAVGLGEAPILRQATFSLWESQAAMDAYARSGPHLQAIRAANAGGWFSESMFVRFLPLVVQGCWRGRSYG